jgi:transposase-like protein
VIWLWGLPVGLLLGTSLGLVLAKWPYRWREQRGQAGSVTDLGESFALVNELRREITRLRQAIARLQADRAASCAALARVADSLEREARRLPVQAIHPASRAPGEGPGTERSPSRSVGA